MTAPAHETTALHRHVAFFDRDGDGLVSVRDVVDRLRHLGCGAVYAHINAVGGMLARTTGSELLAHDVLVHRAHEGKYRHPALQGETRIFDREGRFDAARFDEILAMYARSGVDGLTESDIDAMIADLTPPGTVSESSARLAFRLLFTIAGEPTACAGEPDTNVALFLSRDRLRAFYTGELLPALAEGQRNTSEQVMRSDQGSAGTHAQHAVVSPRRRRNREPVASTLGGVVVGALRAVSSRT